MVRVIIIDFNLEFNMLLGQSWMSQMSKVYSSLFSMLKFIYDRELEAIKCKNKPILKSITLVETIQEEEESSSPFISLGSG